MKEEAGWIATRRREKGAAAEGPGSAGCVLGVTRYHKDSHCGVTGEPGTESEVQSGPKPSPAQCRGPGPSLSPGEQEARLPLLMSVAPAHWLALAALPAPPNMGTLFVQALPTGSRKAGQGLPGPVSKGSTDTF